MKSGTGISPSLFTSLNAPAGVLRIPEDLKLTRRAFQQDGFFRFRKNDHWFSMSFILFSRLCVSFFSIMFQETGEKPLQSTPISKARGEG